MSTTNSSTELSSSDLTRSQRDFYNSTTPGRKSHIIKVLRKHGGNSSEFRKWFSNYKKS